MQPWYNKYQRAQDEQLMVWTASQDKKAFDTLYGRYADRLLAYFHKMLWDDRELAEDLAQDTFIQVFKSAAQFDPGKSFKTWLFSIGYNLCKNEYRRRSSKGTALEIDEAMAWEEPEAGKAQDHAAWEKALTKRVGLLSPSHKSVFLLRYGQDLEIQEIAEVLGIPAGTVKSRLFHLHKKLAGELKAFKTILEQ
jgi:RNA polymerase sigma-70 factor (ECF subfamily)